MNTYTFKAGKQIIIITADSLIEASTKLQKEYPEPYTIVDNLQVTYA